jgi:SAM-dependent methyltransferase
MKLYDQLADWWPLLSAPSEYEEEAAVFGAFLSQHGDLPAATVLELGSGGGNLASYLKAKFQMTLSDASEAMLAVSRGLNPECEHVAGDMRRLRLGRQFDRVFVHDAICYMTTLDELRCAMETAFVHCRPGGAALFVPDYLHETFGPSTSCGGTDGGGRGLRYVAWMSDANPIDSTYIVDYAYLLREADGTMRVEHDRHVEGVFSRRDWLRLLAEVGFEAQCLPWEHSELEPGSAELFVGVRPQR